MNPMSTTRRSFLASGAAAAATTVQSAQRRPIRLGLLGCGRITQMNVPLLKPRIDAGDLQITVCCDLYQKRLREMAELTGAEPTTDYKTVLQRGDVDFVYIGTPDHWHAPMTLESIAAGKDVIVEKPMTRTTAEARAVYRAVKESGCIFTTGSRSLRHGAYWVARDIVKTGVLGHLLWAQTSRTQNFPTSGEYIPGVQQEGAGHRPARRRRQPHPVGCIQRERTQTGLGSGPVFPVAGIQGLFHRRVRRSVMVQRVRHPPVHRPHVPRPGDGERRHVPAQRTGNAGPVFFRRSSIRTIFTLP